MSIKTKIPSTELIDDLAKSALQGNTSALVNLKRINKQLVKTANQALTRLEKSGFTRYAYSRAVSYTETITGKSRFTTSEKYLEDVGDIVRNIRELKTFLNSKSATVSGNRQIDKEILETFELKGIRIPKESQDEFFDFLNSDEWEILKKDYVGSDQLVEDIARASNVKGANFENIINELSKIVSDKNQTYDIALEKLGVKL